MVGCGGAGSQPTKNTNKQTHNHSSSTKSQEAQDRYPESSCHGKGANSGRRGHGRVVNLQSHRRGWPERHHRCREIALAMIEPLLSPWKHCPDPCLCEPVSVYVSACVCVSLCLCLCLCQCQGQRLCVCEWVGVRCAGVRWVCPAPTTGSIHHATLPAAHVTGLQQYVSTWGRVVEGVELVVGAV